MTNPSQTFGQGWGAYLAPAAVGSAYAISKISTLRLIDVELALQQDFKMLFLAGILLGFALRPIIQRIYWYKGVCILTTAWFLLILGPPGQFLEKLAWEPVFEETYWKTMIPEITAAIVVAVISAILMPPRYLQLNFAQLKRRIVRFFSFFEGIKLCSGGLVYFLLIFTTQGVFNSDPSVFEDPMMFLNTFFIQSPVSPWLKVAYFWLRGITCIGALLPLLSILKGTPANLTLIVGSLFFVVADFTPAFANLQGIAPYLLMEQLVQRLFIDFIFCYIVVRLFGQSSS